MLQFSRPPLTSLCIIGVLATGHAPLVRGEDAAIASDSAVPLPPQSGGYVDPVNQWLDEVKAQRQAWEARRQAAKEAVNARRRLNDPWGAAEKEAREKESQRRRDAILEQVERDHDAFRSQIPWHNYAPWESGPPPPPLEQPAQLQAVPQSNTAHPDSTALNPIPTQDTVQHPTDPQTYPPSGWDNRWYYRGY